jgi:GrpB-like predicted nucleotidyltransferase (UPF0157 family)
VIEIVSYRAVWPAEFESVRAGLLSALGTRALRIDHVGSTAVPGLDAKDVIDVQVTVLRLSDADPLRAAGYTESVGFRDHRPPGTPGGDEEWRKRFFAPPAGERRANIHVREQGRANARYALLFRDYLRARPDAAAAYAELKRRLASALADPSTYPDVKDPACDLIWIAAGAWAETVGWRG